MALIIFFILMTENNIPIITIDGSSGSGKGAISYLLAKKLNWHLLDSGAVYRVLAFASMKKHISSNDIPALISLAKNLNIEFISHGEVAQKIIFEGEDVTTLIRQEECGNVASKIASFPEVRAILVDYQRSFCKVPGLIADGRDMGTVIFPDAMVKIFLTAAVEERAKRRLLQLQDQGINATLGDVLRDLVARDKRDCNRLVSPLKPHPAAMIIDTTKLSINEVLQQVLVHVKVCLNLH